MVPELCAKERGTQEMKPRTTKKFFIGACHRRLLSVPGYKIRHWREQK
jgi:hypothetical protein